MSIKPYLSSLANNFSHLKIDNFTGKNKFRILCFMYLKLAMSWIAALIYALVQSIVGEKQEISLFKFTKWLHLLGEWNKSLVQADFTELIKAFERDKHLLRKQVKKKKNQSIVAEKKINKKYFVRYI